MNKNKEKKDKEEYYPAEEQGVEKEKTSEEKSQEMDINEEDEDVYTEEGREKLTEDDEISPGEEAFMEGAKETGELGNCATCGKPIGEARESVIEKEIDGVLYWFCSNKCANKFNKKIG